MKDYSSSLSPQLEFIRIFNFSEEEEVIPWTDNDPIGFSIIKEYPKTGLFRPTYTKEGKQDSVALIKVGYYNSNKNEITLRVNIHKVSRYLLKEHWDFNFEDTESPTKESLDESKASRQPIDLEELSRYIFHVNTQKIFDLEKNDYIDPKFIVEDIYKTHLKTLKDIPFRVKMAIKNNSFSFIGPTNEFLLWLNFFLFGRQIKETTKNFTGVLEPYSHKALLSLSTEKTKILGSDFPITNQTARTFVFFISALFLIDYYLKFDILGIVALVKKSAENNLFLATLTTALIIFFDRILPHLILFIMNIFVKARLRIWTWRVKIKSASSTNFS